MSQKNPIFLPEILKSGYPLDFFGLFHGANRYDHRSEIKFQRISAKKMLKMLKKPLLSARGTLQDT